MTYELTVEPKAGYLHAIVTGQNSAESVQGYLKELLHECQTRQYAHVLLEERLEGPRLSLVDVFHIVSSGTEEAHGIVRAIAFVDVNAVGDTMKFAETVASNRSIRVQVFPNVSEAEKWLGEVLDMTPGA